MRVRQGVQAEVLVSLALVMVTGTALLAAVFLEINQSRVETLHDLLGRGFVASAGEATFEHQPIDAGLWWRIDGAGRVTGLNASAGVLDEATRALGAEALSLEEPLVQSGAPWAPIRFATPRRQRPGVLVGRIDAPVSGVVLLGLLVTDVLIFGLFGVTLLRRRVVGPLHRLAVAARELGGGELTGRVPVEGAGEIEELATAFNDMQEALASRTGALEKAVIELRSANASLLQAREGLDRAERLAMVGSLAAGVAHEVGNPMGALLAFLDVAGRDEGLGPDARRALERATEQGERVRVILRQLLDFSRPPRVEHGPLDLPTLVRQSIELVSAQRAYADIEFEVEVRDDPGPAMGDAGLVSQILLNLALNAAAAMEGAQTRKIHFEIAGDVRRRRAGDRGAGGQGAADRGAASPDASRIDSIVCRVGDSGTGIRLDDPERIFDPFFTTKAPGEGTGLGLANARKLAQEMGGDVELEEKQSRLGGALFRLTLPLEVVNPSDGIAVRTGDVAVDQSRMP